MMALTAATIRYFATRIIWLFVLFLPSILVENVYSQTPSLSTQRVKFYGENTIGRVLMPCSMKYDSTNGSFIITGSGTNMWFNEDDFYFVWNRVEGDFRMMADVNWVGEGKQPHRKAGWMVRASLDSNAPYADAVIHGDSLICLQYRSVKDDSTKEIRSQWRAPATLLFEKKGNNFTLKIIKDGRKILVGSVDVNLPRDVYAGLAVCSHDSTTQETAVFSRVKFQRLGR
jgi:TolB protein